MMNTSTNGNSDRMRGDRGTLDRLLVTGIAWTGLAKWSTQILSWLSTIVVARLLTPQDYGLVSMALVYVGFAQLVNEFGLGAAIVQNRQLDDREVGELGGVAVLVAVTLVIVSILVARPVASFYGEPIVAAVIWVLSITFLAGAFQVVPRSLLMRDLEFKKLAGIDVAEAVSMIGVTLTLAIVGAGRWALIVGSVVGRLVATAVVLVMRPFPVRMPRSFGSIKASLTFGGHVVIANVAWFTYRNADLAIVGRVLGKSALGVYYIAYTIASGPLERLNALMSRVLPGVFSGVQDDVAMVRRYVLGVTEALSMITFPAAVGLVFVADDLVLAVLGENWRGAVVPLRILALAGAFRSLGPVLSQALIYIGEPRRNTEYSVLAALVLPPLFIIGARWGVGGVAVVILVVQPLVALVTTYRHIFNLAQIRGSDYFRGLWPALSSTAFMAGLLLLLRMTVTNDLIPSFRLSADVAVGALGYGLFMVSFHRRRFTSFVASLRAG